MTQTDFKLELQKIKAEEAQCNRTIIEILSEQINHQNAELTRNECIEDFEAIRKEISDLNEEVQRVNEEGRNLFHDIRKLKNLKTQVASCIGYLQSMDELRFVCESTKKALADEDFEQAAGCIRRYNIQLANLKDINCPEITENCNVMDDLQEKLSSIARKSLKEADESRDVPMALRFLKVISLLPSNHHQLTEFYRHVLNEFSNKMSLADTKEQDDGTPLFLTNRIVKLLDVMAELIEAYIPIFETYYDPSRTVDFIDELISACATDYSKLIDAYKISSGVTDVVDNSTQQHLADNPKSFSLSVRFEHNLNQMSFIIQHSEMFLTFLRQKFLSTSTFNMEIQSDKLDIVETRITKSRLFLASRDLVSIYVHLECCSTNNSIGLICSKSFGKETSGKDAICSSSTTIDDMFFVFRKCISRAARTSNSTAFSEVLSNVCSNLNRFGERFIWNKIRQGCISNTHFMSTVILNNNDTYSSLSSDKKFINFLIAMNNSQLALDCMQELIEQMLDKSDAFIKLRDRFISHLKLSWEKLQTDFVRTMLMKVSEDFSNANHILNKTTSKHNKRDDFIYKSTEEFKIIYTLPKQTLLECHHNQLMSIMLDEFTAALERGIRSSKFDIMGGLLLEQEIRNFVVFLSKLTDVPVRKKFVRLNRIARLLASDTFDTVVDNDDANADDKTSQMASPDNKLSKEDIKYLIKLRVDL